MQDTPARDAAITNFKLPMLGISLVGTIGLAWIVLQQVLPLASANGWRLEYMMAVVFCAFIFIPVGMMML